MGFKISVKASKDIEQIWLYTIEHWSLEQADRYINQIFDEIEYLSEHPYTGKDFSYIRKGYRTSKVKSHMIFYRFNTDNDPIEIIRVLHQRMDIEQRLNE